jgi:hypothetical protein
MSELGTCHGRGHIDSNRNSEACARVWIRRSGLSKFHSEASRNTSVLSLSAGLKERIHRPFLHYTKRLR